MKLTSIELHPDGSSEFLAFSFRDPHGENPYNVKDIKGLDADDIVPQYIGSSAGSASYNLIQTSRTIVIKMGLNPDFSDGTSYSDLRDDVYKMIAYSRTGKIKLHFKEYNLSVATISGHISKYESERFEKEQQVQLTIKCDTTMLTSPKPVLVEILEKQYPTSNTIIRDNLSTSPHGFTFEADVSAGEGIPWLAITDPNDIWYFWIAPNGGFHTDDRIYFSNEEEKYLYITRAGNRIYLADAIVQGSTWPRLFPGENHLVWKDAIYVDWVSFSYHPTYWGV
jgi:hypothetical protein